jgi:hypothetical protein
MDCIKPADRSSSAVVAALAEAHESGRTLYLPGGDTYEIDQPLEVVTTTTQPRAVSIVGDGPGRTVLRSHVAGSLLRLRTATPASQQAWYSSIAGLEITGDGSEDQSGVELRDQWLGAIRDCHIHDIKQDGIAVWAEAANTGIPRLTRIERCAIWRCGRHGVRLGRASEIYALPYQVAVDGCDVEWCGDCGIYAEADAPRISRSIVAYCGSPTGHGGVFITGVPGYTSGAAIVESVGFERNWPYHLGAQRAFGVRVSESAFIRATDGERSCIEAGDEYVATLSVERCMFRSQVAVAPVVAVRGGVKLASVRLRDCAWNLKATDARYAFDPKTRAAIEEL